MTDIISTVLALGIVGVFGTSGIGKLVEPRAAARAAQVVSGVGSPALVRVLAVAEVVLAAALLVGDRPVVRVAALVAAAVTTGLTAVVIRLVRRAPSMACGCFGAGARAAGPVDLVRNAVVVLAGLALAAFPVALPSWLPPSLRLPAAVSAVVVVVVATVVATVRGPRPRPQLWVFLSGDCPDCRRVLDAVSDVFRSWSVTVELRVVLVGETGAMGRAVPVRNTVSDPTARLARSWSVTRYPAAIGVATGRPALDRWFTGSADVARVVSVVAGTIR